jgi:hypothetical protein
MHLEESKPVLSIIFDIPFTHGEYMPEFPQGYDETSEVEHNCSKIYSLRLHHIL